ncbi:hypothetical protein J6590_069121 [Homalodisca vitripennis]|nr:hypothetical protein J6590_069121 [Homalodisca vitripennis]
MEQHNYLKPSFIYLFPAYSSPFVKFKENKALVLTFVRTGRNLACSKHQLNGSLVILFQTGVGNCSLAQQDERL